MEVISEYLAYLYEFIVAGLECKAFEVFLFLGVVFEDILTGVEELKASGALLEAFAQLLQPLAERFHLGLELVGLLLEVLAFYFLDAVRLLDEVGRLVNLPLWMYKFQPFNVFCRARFENVNNIIAPLLVLLPFY